MRDVVTISLDDVIKAKLDALTEETQMSRSDIVRDLLLQYFRREKLIRLRENMKRHAQTQGIFTDEDVFERMC